MDRFKTSLLFAGRFEPSRTVDLAQMAEALGYDIFWMADERFFREVYSSLTLVADHTKRINVGTCVTDPYSRHPALTALAIATLDEISGGRAVLGIGAGVSGFAQLGIRRSKPVVAMREMVELVRRLWSGEAVDFQGQLVQFNQGHLDFRPLRSRIPIYIASNGEQGLALAGQVAEGAMMESALTAPSLDFFFSNVARGAARAGRSPQSVDMVARVNMCLADDVRKARDAMRPGIARVLVGTQPDFATFTVAGVTVSQAIREAVSGLGYTHDSHVLAPVVKLVPDEHVDALTVAGDVDQVTDVVVRLVKRGITHVTLSAIGVDGNPERTIKDFAERVMPQVRQHVGGLND